MPEVISNFPANVDAECSVLGSIIEDPTLLDTALEMNLKDDDFSLSDHQKIYRVILKMRQKGIPLDTLTLAEALGNSDEAIAVITDLICGVVVGHDHTAYHIRIILEKSALRSLLNLGEWITSCVYEAGADPDQIRQRIHKQIQEFDSQSKVRRIPLDDKPLERQIV